MHMMVRRPTSSLENLILERRTVVLRRDRSSGQRQVYIAPLAVAKGLFASL